MNDYADSTESDEPVEPASSLVDMRYLFALRRFSPETFPVVPQCIRAEPKISRNAPCPCGSGKKYKRCCGAD